MYAAPVSVARYAHTSTLLGNGKILLAGGITDTGQATDTAEFVTSSTCNEGDAQAPYVTHDQQEAIFMGDRIAVMRKGRLEQFGTFDDLYYTPANLFVATFIGTPPMSVIPAQVSGNTLRVEDATWELPPDLAATVAGRTSVRLGMRAGGWDVGSGATMPVRFMERIPTEQAAFAHGTLNGTSVTVILPLDAPNASQIHVTPRWDTVHLFDANDETALHTPGIPDLF